MSELVIDATWKLPEGHESVGAYATLTEATLHARHLVEKDRAHAFYMMDKRGAAEVIRYPRVKPSHPGNIR